MVASERELVLLDEPSSQIDRATREQLRPDEIFGERTVIYVDHDGPR
jgi:ABC-type nitrate/sulfonate/bicarbonate transport system ATPase subunit